MEAQEYLQMPMKYPINPLKAIIKMTKTYKIA